MDPLSVARVRIDEKSVLRKTLLGAVSSATRRRIAAADALVAIAAGRYSVPVRYVGQAVDVRETATRVAMARFPFQKTLDAFDFRFQPSIDPKVIRELATGCYLESGQAGPRLHHDRSQRARSDPAPRRRRHPPALRRGREPHSDPEPDGRGRCVIASYEVIIQSGEAGDGHTDTIHKVRLKEQVKFVELTAKYLGLLAKKVEVTNLDKCLALLDEGRARNAAASAAAKKGQGE